MEYFIIALLQIYC